MWRMVGLFLLGAALLFVSLSSAARAEESVAPPSAWEFDAGFYGWFPWVGGTATARGETFNVYATPIDLIEHFDAPPAMFNFEARHGKLSFFGDVLYSKFAFDDSFAAEAQPIPSLQLKGSGNSTTDYTLGVYQFGLFYQVADFAGMHGNTMIDLGTGARFIEQELRVKARIDASAQIRLGKLVNRIERRIQRIENQEQRLEALSALNAVRKDVLSEPIVRAQDKGRTRRVARLQQTLGRDDQRGQALAALEAVEALRFELLRAALSLDGDEFNRQFAFVDSGSMDWVDPTIAVRVRHEFANGNSITAWGDFGGWNVQEGLSWQAILTYDIDGTLFGFNTTTSLGYKALWLQFEDQTPKGMRGIDAVLHGPIAEVAVRW